MKPKIIMHTQISLDGRIKGFDNPEVYYQVAGGIHSDHLQSQGKRGYSSMTM